MRQFSLLFLASLLVVSTFSLPIENEQQIVAMEPRILSFMTDFYNQIVAEPVNHLASSLAAMVSQVTASFALNGIKPLIGKRDVEIMALQFVNAMQNFFQSITQNFNDVFGHLLQGQFPRGFFDNLAQAFTNAMSSAVSAVTNTLLPQLLALSQGSRDAKGALDNIVDSLYQLGNQAVQSIALAITQALANFSVGKRDLFAQLFPELADYLHGLHNILVLGGVIPPGKRGAEEMRGSLDDFLNAMQSSLYDLGNQAVQSIALAITQALANFSVGKRDLLNQLFPELGDFLHFLHNYLILGGVIAPGKRSAEEIRGSLDDFLNAMQSSLYELGNQAVQSIALAVTQALANFSIGKRQTKGSLDDFLNAMQSSLYDLGNQAVQSIALAITQALANFSVGKRQLVVPQLPQIPGLNELLNLLQSLAQTLGKRDLFAQLFPQLADYFHGLHNILVLGGVIPPGKRGAEEMRGQLDDFLNTMQSSLYDLANTAVSQIALAITQALANFSVGKRGLSDFVSNFGSNVFNSFDSLVQSAALQLTSLLVHITNHGVMPTIGKRGVIQNADQFVQQLLNLLNQTANQIIPGSGSHLIGK